MSNNQVEIIKCLCGSTMAACVVEHIDGEWITNKKNYLKKGYTTYIVDAGNFQFAKCKHDKEHNTENDHCNSRKGFVFQFIAD